MIRKLGILVAVIAAFAMATQSAEAKGKGKRQPINPTIAATAVGVGAASTAAYFTINDWNWSWDQSRHGITHAASAYAITSIGCMAISPMVASAVLKRPLKYREAGILMGSCVIPIIGGWLVNEAYNSGLVTAPDEVAPAKKKVRVAKKKM